MIQTKVLAMKRIGLMEDIDPKAMTNPRGTATATVAKNIMQVTEKPCSSFSVTSRKDIKSPVPLYLPEGRTHDSPAEPLSAAIFAPEAFLIKSL